MNIDQIAFEIYPGVMIIPYQLLCTMREDPNCEGTTRNDLPADEIEKQWLSVIQICPDIEKFSFQDKEDLKCRLFTKFNILLASTFQASEKFRFNLEHEWFHKICLNNEGAREILFEGYKAIYADQDMGFSALGFFSNSPYGRFPHPDEFWAQWFRQSLFEGNELKRWELFKGKVRSREAERIVLALKCFDELSRQVIEEISAIYPEVESALLRYQHLPKCLNFVYDESKHKVIQKIIVQGDQFRLEWDREKDKNDHPVVTFGDQQILWVHFYWLYEDILRHRLCLKLYCSESESHKKAFAEEMEKNLKKIIGAVQLYPKPDMYEHCFYMDLHTRYFLIAKDSEERTYWYSRVNEKLDKIGELLELKKLVEETMSYHGELCRPYFAAILKKHAPDTDGLLL